MRTLRGSLPLLSLVLALQVGCATYSDRLTETRLRVTAGDLEGGIGTLDVILDVDESQPLPDRFDSDAALAVLERGTLFQAIGEYENAARDMGVADEQLQLLDIAGDAVGNIGKYVYSDSATKYQASPMEKLSLNGFNMLNYLAEGNLRGARVEARRFTVMRQYLRDFAPEDAHGSFGSYLAGFVFERLGEVESAMRYYDEALAHRGFETLRGPIARLAPRALYRGQHVGPFLASGTSPPPPGANAAEILTVVSVGRVPFKIPERMPIGAAIGIGGAFISGNPEVLGYSVFKVVVYPELAPPDSVFDEATLRIDGEEALLELASNLGAEIRREYESLKPRILGAALSRMIVRAAAAEAARAAGGQQSSGLGWFLALLTEGALVAGDKPDTRSWQFLPGRVFVSRETVAPGRHTVEIDLDGVSKEKRTVEVEAPPGGFAVVVLTVPR